MKNLVSFDLFEGKAFKASKNPYGSVTKEDKKDQLRKAVEDHIKDKECKTKKVGDDFEIHCASFRGLKPSALLVSMSANDAIDSRRS